MEVLSLASNWKYVQIVLRIWHLSKMFRKMLKHKHKAWDLGSKLFSIQMQMNTFLCLLSVYYGKLQWGQWGQIQNFGISPNFEIILSPLDQVCSQVLGACLRRNFLKIFKSLPYNHFLVKGGKIVKKRPKIQKSGLNSDISNFAVGWRFYLIGLDRVTC